nr:DNA primase [Bacillus sp. FJAT-49736]
MIPEEKINEIRQSIDIVDVIGEYVHLKKQGRNYFGLCPFHGENTPSFSVSSDKQIFHCFGCGAGGNAITFIMDIDGLGFQEAVIKLAEKANIVIDIDSNIQKHAVHSNVSEEQQKMLEAHELLKKFYHHLLVNTKEGQDAFEYLTERGFTRESIEKFQVGYSLSSWDFTVKLLQKRGFPLSIMEKAGLIIKRENDDSYFDRFRNRIMFPIVNSKGHTVAFSGRVLDPNEQPKYLNSPETELFNKSSVLYNFHQARSFIKKQQQAILFEGFADVISADRANIFNGIATMGTALTDQHVQQIRRLTDSVIICYDSDSAGTEAAYRAGKMLDEHHFNLRIARMPDGLDPDDYIKRNGAEKFRQDVIGASMTFMAFKMQYHRIGKKLQNEGEKLKYIEIIINEISQLENPVERDHYLKQLADEFSISMEALKQQQRQTFFANKKKNSFMQENSNHKVILRPEKNLFPAFQTAERRLISHMLRDIEIAYKVRDLLDGHTFNIDEHQAIFTYLLGFYEEGNQPDTSSFLTYLPDEQLRRTIADIEMMPLNNEVSNQELEDYIDQVLKHQKMLKIKEKIKEQNQAELENDLQRASAIALEILQLRRTLQH